MTMPDDLPKKDDSLQTAAIAGGGLGILTIGLGVLVAVVIFAAVAATASALLGIFSLGGGENQTSSITPTGIAPPLIKDRLAAADCLNRWIAKRQPSSPFFKPQAPDTEPLALRIIDAALNQDMPYNPALIPAIADAESTLGTNGSLVDGSYSPNPKNSFGITGSPGKFKTQRLKGNSRDFIVFASYGESIDYIGPYLPRMYFKQGITTLEALRDKYCGVTCTDWLSTVSKDLNDISASCPDFAQPALASGYLSGKLSPPVDPFPPNSPTTYTGHHAFRVTKDQSEAGPGTSKKGHLTQYAYAPDMTIYAGDISAKVDTEIRAAAEGTLWYDGIGQQSRENKAYGCSGKDIGGNFEFTSSDGSTFIYYAHIYPSGDFAGMKEQTSRPVHRNQVFAAVSGSGRSCGVPHLHLEIQIDGQAIPCSRFDDLFGLPKRGCRNTKKGVTYT